MTWLDGGGIVLVLSLTLLGFFTGLMRRVLGVAAAGLALFAGTKVGPSVGLAIMHYAPVSVPEAGLLGFFGMAVAVLVLSEVLAGLNHDRLQISVVLLNRASGALLGGLTGILLAILFNFILMGYAYPPSGTVPDEIQRQVAAMESSSWVIQPASKRLGPTLNGFLRILLPADVQRFFTA